MSYDGYLNKDHTRTKAHPKAYAFCQNLFRRGKYLREKCCIEIKCNLAFQSKQSDLVFICQGCQ